jgi:hypothetical protein
MHADELATTAVAVLGARLPAIADGDAALGDLYDLVRGRLVRDGREAAFTAYATNPDNNALVQDLLRHAAETDAAFAAALLDAVDRAQRTAPAPPGSSSVSMRNVSGTITAAGRDITTNNEKKTTIYTGGLILLAAAAIVAVLVFVATYRGAF